PVAPSSPDYVPRPEHPSSLDYVPGPEHPPSPIEIPYVSEPEYPEYLEEDPEEDPEDDQADYPADGGDGDDEPSDDDDDDDTDDEDPKEGPFEEDDEEEEEHPAPADSFAVPIVDLTRLRRARKTIRPVPPMSASMEACIARHAALPSPPLLAPCLPLPLPSPLTTSPTDTGAPLGYRAAGIRMRVLLASTSCRTDIHEADMPPRKKACLTTLAPRFEIGESSTAGAARQPGPTNSDLRRCRVEQAGYGITDTDRPDHHRTAMFMNREAIYSREAWAFSIDRTSAIAAHVRTLETQSMSFQGTEGVVGLTQWIEKMESVLQINNYTIACQVKFTSRTLQRSTFTWWNSHMRAVGHDVAYAIPWVALKRMITSLDLLNYNHRFQELALMYKRMFSEEVEKKLDDTSRNNQHQQQPFKRNNVARAYTDGPRDKKPYEGIKPLCPNRPATNNNNNNHQRAQRANARGITCFECGVQGHYKSECPKLKNGNQWNRAGNGNAVAKACAVGTAGTNPNSNVVTGTFLLNNRYALVLFDTSADRSFVSTAFSSLIDIIPTTLDHGYDVELADGTKDETSFIIKSFITEIENLVDKKVKIIRCNNGKEFKNRVMSEFYEKKGIKKEFSIARTPHQNGVAERRNMTLIEAARTMVLVVKPHNKISYELFKGRTPALSFMRPYGCHVTILNTLEHLGKYDGKYDDGFFVGYSLNSKAFRVYNIRTRKVKENLHIRFLENKPIIAGDGPKWLYDIDTLTKLINYVPVVAGKNFNDFNANNDEPQPSSDAGKKNDDGVTIESGINNQKRPENSTQDVNTTGPSINTVSTNVNTGSLNINIVSPSVTNAPLEATHADLFSDET
nr:ribonuclease H-like domain-containing protein [Tanacetum cinerariifolium]